ncbi:MAG: Gfo/Idh/MocA family protein [Fimbriimonadaceae bacterium]
MADRIAWGILGTGRIARAFAKGLRASKTGVLAAVGSRSLGKASAFCDEFGGSPHGSYESLLDDARVQAVYIATPHHTHAGLTVAAARAGKAILCEKPFTLSLREAETALQEVRRAGVFFMEAFMYRCHPQIAKLRELLADGAIGAPTYAHSEFGFDAPDDWDDFRADPALGGGALMDVGTYCVSFSLLVAGSDFHRAEYRVRKHPRGYDAVGAGLLSFPDGFVATFATAVHQELRNGAVVYGRKGRIELDSPWVPGPGATLRLVRQGGAEEFRLHPEGGDLYAMEADAAAASLSLRECAAMPWRDTLENMRALDALRRSADLLIPESR